MNPKRYKKLIVAAVGVAAVMFGPEYVPDQAAMVEAILAVSTLVAVYQVRNEE